MRTLRVTALGWGVALAACSLPNVGLWSGRAHADVGLYGLYGGRIAHGAFPYRPGFSMEFPPGSIPPMAVPALPGGSYAVWFHVFELGCLLACVAAVGYATRRVLPTLLAAVAPALIGPIALNSFDLWPAALAAWGVALTLRGRPRWGMALIAAATAAKLYPVLLAPALLAYVLRDRARDEAKRAAAVGIGVLAVAFLPFAAAAPGGLEYSLREQATRGLQVESLGGSALGVAHRLGAGFHVVTTHAPFSFDIAGSFADAVATIFSLCVLAAAYVAWRLLVRGPVDTGRTLHAVAATAVAFVAFGKVLSPQYLLFLVPLVPLADSLPASALFAGALALTQVWARFPEPFLRITRLGWPVWVALARNLLLVCLYVLLVAALRRRRATSQA